MSDQEFGDPSWLEEPEETYDEGPKEAIDLGSPEPNTEDLEIPEEFENLFGDNSEGTEPEEPRTGLQDLSEHPVETGERRKFSLYREQTLDQGLLEELQALLDSLEQKAEEAFEKNDLGTPPQLQLLSGYLVRWRDAYLERPGLGRAGFPTIRTAKKLT
ncbi:hypothetical protein GX51_08275 [Blastomyces parvus]|uniref:Uncharacterized protein n=1 Tax=Blastomyces parvus TaxID=2060905 RepID=A0A2B7WFF2_9EURO|nr:hypothetical protein GX51_08275 [Blastomyces parvus]